MATTLKMIVQTLHLDSNAITTIQTNAFQVFFSKFLNLQALSMIYIMSTPKLENNHVKFSKPPGLL